MEFAIKIYVKVYTKIFNEWRGKDFVTIHLNFEIEIGRWISNFTKKYKLSFTAVERYFIGKKPMIK